MKDRFPRTAGEFLEHGRAVVLRCQCGATTWIRPPNLIQRLGPDYDLYDGFGELVETFPCDECGALLREISFSNPGEKNFGPVSFEEATTNSLELSAFANARDGAEARRKGLPWPPKRRTMGRVRKFGRA